MTHQNQIGYMCSFQKHCVYLGVQVYSSYLFAYQATGIILCVSYRNIMEMVAVH